MVLLIANFFAILFAIYFFDRIGVIRVTPFLYTIFPQLKTAIEGRVESPTVEKLRELENLEKTLREKEIALNKREEGIRIREEELKRKEEEINLKTKELEESKELFERSKKEFQTRKEVIRKIGEYIGNIPPDKAVQILENMDDTTIAEVLLYLDAKAEEEGRISVSPLLLSLMNPKRAANIQSKLFALKQAETQ